MSPQDSDNPLAAEIQQETAATYFAACRKMVAALEALKAFDHAADTAPRDHGQTERRSELLDEAAERVFFVLIQREAMKLSWYEEFYEDYRVPGEVKIRVGSKRGT